MMVRSLEALMLSECDHKSSTSSVNHNLLSLLSHSLLNHTAVTVRVACIVQLNFMVVHKHA